MAQNSGISWTHHTFNPYRGCSKVSEGCRNCYAETLSGRNPGTLGIWGPNGTRVLASESMWKEPIKWNRWAEQGVCYACGGKGKDRKEACEACAGTGKMEPYRARVFCASMADVFENWTGPMLDSTGRVMECVQGETREWARYGTGPLTMDDVRRRLFTLILDTPNIDWLILTKRPENIKRMVEAATSSPICDLPIVHSNVWMGTSIEDARVLERLAHLKAIPAAVRWISAEPLLGSLDAMELEGLHWVVAGGESGNGARGMHPDWARRLRDRCVAAGVAFHFKQHGEYRMIEGAHYHDPAPPNGTGGWQSAMEKIGKKAAGRLLDGREWNEFPAVAKGGA